MLTPSPESHDADPWIDPAVLAQLAEELDREGVAEMIGMFFDSLPDQVAACQSSHRAGDFPTLEREAHSIKGAAASLGAARLTEIARRLEAAAEAQDAGGAQVILQDLPPAAETTLARLDAWLGSTA